MSKEISVIVPDNYRVDNVIERIKDEFNNDSNIIVTSKGDLDAYLSDIIQAVGEFQQKLRRIRHE